jgi:hypothetical protein
MTQTTQAQTVVATVTSAPSPINGNENNSSPNFEFLELPPNGNLTVSITSNPNADSITFTLWHQKNNWSDSVVKSNLANGSTNVAASDVTVGDTYYIGNPSNAGGQNFVVSFLAG